VYWGGGPGGQSGEVFNRGFMNEQNSWTGAGRKIERHRYERMTWYVGQGTHRGEVGTKRHKHLKNEKQERLLGGTLEGDEGEKAPK